MEHLKILLWAATHSKDFKYIEFNSPIQGYCYKGFGQIFEVHLTFIWEIESLIRIPYDVQMHYHAQLIKKRTNLDFAEIMLPDYDDGIPF